MIVYQNIARATYSISEQIRWDCYWVSYFFKLDP